MLTVGVFSFHPPFLADFFDFGLFQVVFFSGSSKTSSNKIFKIWPIFGPGWILSSSISLVPSILRAVTDNGARIASSIIDSYFRKRYGLSFGRPIPMRSQKRTFINSQMFSGPTLRTSRRTADKVIFSVSEKNKW